jgi:GntR family transcriptional repressor for pyruvate dehydrogenase complex
MVHTVTAQTLTQAVAEHLRTLIHQGEVGPGERLPAERELAERLGVARASLREAIKVLQQEGYVQVRRGALGGTYVTELIEPLEKWRMRMRTQTGEFDDIIDFRIALETQTARMAAIRRDRADLARLRTSIKSLGQVSSDYSAFRLSDAQFHAWLARAAGNLRLETAVESARGELFVPHDLLAYTDPTEGSRRDHQQIYEAVRDGNPGTAASAMREHIERTRHQLRQIVFGSGNGSIQPTP